VEKRADWLGGIRRVRIANALAQAPRAAAAGEALEALLVRWASALLVKRGIVARSQWSSLLPPFLRFCLGSVKRRSLSVGALIVQLPQNCAQHLRLVQWLVLQRPRVRLQQFGHELVKHWSLMKRLPILKILHVCLQCSSTMLVKLKCLVLHLPHIFL